MLSWGDGLSDEACNCDGPISERIQTMRINQTEGYRYHLLRGCPLDECGKRYCEPHRLLWVDCDTAELTYDGAGCLLHELKDCPICVQEEKRERYLQLVKGAL